MAIIQSEQKKPNLDDWRKATFDELFDAVALQWKGWLNLRNWDIWWTMAAVVGDSPDNEAHVAVRTPLGHEAEITLADRVAGYGDKQREELVVHELVHIILDEACEFAFHYLPEEHHAYFRRQVEIAVSDLTHALVDIAHKDDAKPEG